MSRITSCIALSIACAELSVLAQSTEQAPQTTFRTGVDVVRLDVSVLDANRRPVRGLTAADFTVLEGGKPQSIVAFSAIGIPHAETPPARWMRDVGSDVATNGLDTRRVVVIVMDDGVTESDPGVAKFGKQIARSVIDQLGPNDLAAVVFTFMGRSQNFTTDHSRLIAATETFIPKNSASPNVMSAAASSSGTPRSAGPGMPLGCAFRGRRGCLTDTLKQVANALQDTPPGRKTIVLISSGVPYDFSMENLEWGQDVDDLQETFQNLQRANVNIYPFDPRGLTGEGIISAKLDSLRMFAESTGGRAVLATNAPWDQVSQVFQENSSYYLIGYRSTNGTKDGRFRRVSVKVSRPDLEVRTRSGYYAEKPQQARTKKPAAPVSALQQAFGSALPTGELPLEVSVAPFAIAARKQAALAIVVGTRRPASSQPATEQVNLLATALDANFKERGTVRQTVELNIGPAGDIERRFDLPMRLTLPPGRYEIRVGAESPGAAGGVFIDTDIPDFTKSGLVLSGLLIGRAVPSGNPAGALSDLVPIAPTTRREFERSEPLTAFMRVYQGGKDPLVPVKLTTRITDNASRTAFEDVTTIAPDSFRAGRDADYQFEVSRVGLAAGQYLLTIDASSGKKTLGRSVRFSVK